MNRVENYLEQRYRDLETYLSEEYISLYSSFSNEKLVLIFSTLHSILTSNYGQMNRRLPTGENSAHFWAENSRELILAIDVIRGLRRTLNGTENDFKLDLYYESVIDKSRKFLSSSGGNEIPPHMEQINLYYVDPIFLKKDTITTSAYSLQSSALKLIGQGSYAQVFSCKDHFYQKTFVVKRAKVGLNQKELIRFRQKYEQLKKLSSPYIVEVFCFDESKNQYVTERMDYTLEKYIEKNNNILQNNEQKSILNQILRGFRYIHSKGFLHCDINPRNILIRSYEDIKVCKIAGFGLVKIPDASLTSISTELKGYFNDPGLLTEGFHNYGIEHETYAITRLIYYVMTGKTSLNPITNEAMRQFVEKGLSADKKVRFQSVDELIIALRKL